MTPIALNGWQKNEKELMIWAFCWLIRQVEAHLKHCPEGTAQRNFLRFFKTEIGRMREELCLINTFKEFNRLHTHYCNAVQAVDSVLAQSRAVIINNRHLLEMEPVWPAELDWE